MYILKFKNDRRIYYLFHNNLSTIRYESTKINKDRILGFFFTNTKCDYWRKDQYPII